MVKLSFAEGIWEEGEGRGEDRNHRQHQGEPPIEEIPVGWNSVRRVCMNVDRV